MLPILRSTYGDIARIHLEVPARTWRYDPLPLLIITSVWLLDVAGARTAAPTVADVQIASNAGDDGTYVRGESIHVTLTFSETVEVTGTPQRVAIALPECRRPVAAGKQPASGGASGKKVEMSRIANWRVALRTPDRPARTGGPVAMFRPLTALGSLLVLAVFLLGAATVDAQAPTSITAGQQ